jgi:hypothetical protein
MDPEHFFIQRSVVRGLQGSEVKGAKSMKKAGAFFVGGTSDAERNS